MSVQEVAGGEPEMDPWDPGSGWMESTRHGIQRLRKEWLPLEKRELTALREWSREVGARREAVRAEMREPTGGECAAGQAGGSEDSPALS